MLIEINVTLFNIFLEGCFLHLSLKFRLVPFVFFRLCYVQSLAGHKSPVTAVSASETTGDIATVCDSGIFVSRESCFDLQTQ